MSEPSVYSLITSDASSDDLIGECHRDAEHIADIVREGGTWVLKIYPATDGSVLTLPVAVIDELVLLRDALRRRYGES